MGTPPALPVPAATSTIHEADRGPSKSVEWGPEIDFAAAVIRRKNGLNVVVRGNDDRANRDLARRIEEAVGPWIEHGAHRTIVGHCALPHFQQQTVPPGEHTFFEEKGYKSRRKK